VLDPAYSDLEEPTCEKLVEHCNSNGYCGTAMWHTQNGCSGALFAGPYIEIDDDTFVCSQGGTDKYGNEHPKLTGPYYKEALSVTVSTQPPSSSSIATSGTFTDARDNQTYKWVKIGTQTWMAENLNLTEDIKAGFYVTLGTCYLTEANCTKYGRLYSWTTAMDIDTKYNQQMWNGSSVMRQGICPSGWHLPSDGEWSTLMLYVEGTNNGTAGRYLKATSDWNNEGNGQDTYGFSALPGGYRNTSNFLQVGNRGLWWSASEEDYIGARGRFMNYNIEKLDWDSFSKQYFLSVRCLKN